MLVSGQQDRMLRGADVWGNPVAYDKLGVRYRRWRNSVAAGRHAERAEIESELRPMSAGELFRCAVWPLSCAHSDCFEWNTLTCCQERCQIESLQRLEV